MSLFGTVLKLQNSVFDFAKTYQTESFSAYTENFYQQIIFIALQ